jgi:hypothetical protein
MRSRIRPSEREDGHFRKIEVKLARPGLRVETRSGYFAVPDTGARPVTPEEMAGLKALDTQPRPHAFDFLSRAYRFRDAGGKAQYAIAFEMPISNLTATPEEAGNTHRLHASLLALVKNAQGQIVDRVSKDVPSEVSDDRLAAVQVELMTYQHAVNLPPGTTRWRRPWWITRATAPAPAWSRSTIRNSGEWAERPRAGAAAGEYRPSAGRRGPVSSSPASACSRS